MVRSPSLQTNCVAALLRCIWERSRKLQGSAFPVFWRAVGRVVAPWCGMEGLVLRVCHAFYGDAAVGAGAEVTGSYWYPNINGWSYMLMNVQHPYEDAEDKLCASRSCVFSDVLHRMFPQGPVGQVAVGTQPHRK